MATSSPRRWTRTAISFAEDWRENRDRFRVKRFWEGEPDEVGHLVRKRGGAWAFHYDDIHGQEDDDDEPVTASAIMAPSSPGNTCSINEHDDELRTFRIVSVMSL